jgi:hypothetical protein
MQVGGQAQKKKPNFGNALDQQGFTPHVNHLVKICSGCGGHLISMNFPLRNWEGYYAYFSKVLVGVRTLSLLRSRHKNPPIHMPHDLHRFGS